MGRQTSAWIRRVLVVALLLSISLSQGVAKAAEVDPEEPYSITLSPARTIIELTDETAHHTVRVSNSGESAFEVVTDVHEFKQRAGGDIELFEPSESNGDWLSVSPSTFHLNPGDTQEVSIGVNPANDSEPGDHYLAVLFKVPAKESTGNISVGGAVAAQFLINVPGRAIKDVRVERVKAPRFTDRDTIPIAVELSNRGNVHRDFFAPDNVKARVGNESADFPDFSVLRESSRNIETVWTDPPLVCWCRVEVQIPNDKGGYSSASTRMIVFPFRLVLGSLVMGAGLLVAARERSRRLKRKFDKRIEEARREAYEEALSEVASTR